MFGAPLFLFGVLTAGIPVLIHLLARRKSLPVQWPTLRFLEESNRKTARRRRIEQVLLMLLRAGILAMLAVGLAQPVIRYAGGMLAGSTVVIVVDNSMSMDAKVEARSALGDGLALAQEVLDNLPDSTFVGIVPVVKDPSLGLAGLERGVEAARAYLRIMRPLPGRGSVGDAIRDALELVKSQGSSHQEIYVVTDLQMNAFPLSGEIAARAPNAVLTVVSTARPSPANLTVGKVSAFMPVLTQGEDVSVSAVVTNSTGSAAKTVAALEIDGARRSTQEISVPAGGRTEVSFSARLEAVGLHRIAVTITDDALAGDNAGYAAVFVPQSVDVIIAASGSDGPDADPGFFLNCALNPLSVSGEGAGSIRARRCLPEELTGVDISKFAAVFIDAGASKLLPAVNRELEEYLHRRGTVVQFVGGTPSAFETPDTLAFSQEQLADPLLRRLPGIGLGPFRAVRLNALSDVQVGEGDEVVLKAAQSGKPVLVRKKRASGTEYVFAMSPTPVWGNLVLRGLFPLLVQQIVYSSERVGGATAYDAIAGASIRVPVSGTYDLVSPSGRVARTAGTPDGIETGPLLETGVYTLFPADGKDTAAFVVVNPPAAEGDLRYLSPDVATERLRPVAGNVFSATDSGELYRVTALARKGLPVYDYILAIVVALVVFETFFANRITPPRQKERSPGEVGGVTGTRATRSTRALRLE